MKKSLSTLALGFFVFAALGASGCKATCEKAVANLREIAKKDENLQKRISDEKDEELIAECKKDADKKPESVECIANAKSVEDLMKCKG